MSEPVSEPGAPSDGSKRIPPAQEKSIAKEVERRMPPKATSLLATPDRIILRLNKYGDMT